MEAQGGRFTENKLDTKKTILLSFGFFASMILWSVYNAYVPVILSDNFAASGFFIGLIMSIDNFFGVVFQPLFGRMSDRTRTRFGRRMPFLFVGIPLCVVLFTIIPHMNTLPSMMAVVIGFTFVMGVWRTPAVSLMPDLIPGPFRSQANGIVNLMGGVGAVLAFAGGGLLFELGGFPMPFLVSGLLALAALGVLAVFIREPAYPPVLSKEESKKTEVKLEPQEKKSFILILSAVFFWFMGYNAVETFFSLYAISTLGITPGQASILLAVIGLGVVLFAIPAGFVGARVGRRKTILAGLVGMIALFLSMLFVTNLWAIRAVLFFAGVCWACININSLPMIARISGQAKIGLFIGYYYLFSFSSQLITTPLYGFIYDVVGDYRSLWIYAAITFTLAFVCLLFVRHGEEEPAGL
ncbi:MAG: MFS transporter [Spirochaetes bacterium]|nr:MFS transporter [Spirochaetota bacterium]